jgi:hypothetical protein
MEYCCLHYLHLCMEHDVYLQVNVKDEGCNISKNIEGESTSN